MSWWRDREEGDNCGLKREHGEGSVSSTEEKTTLKTAGCPHVNGFDSWMVKDFWSLMAKIKLRQ